jgi:hypothetical protein
MTIRKLREAVEAGTLQGYAVEFVEVFGAHAQHAAQAYHKDMNAALALMHAVLPGWYWDCGTESLDGTYFGRVETPHAGAPQPHEIIGHADTPARALLLAILKAREAQNEAPA